MINSDDNNNNYTYQYNGNIDDSGAEMCICYNLNVLTNNRNQH